jgi:uncharacterized SAM-binding protein YcdF (DUF218 family)
VGALAVTLVACRGRARRLLLALLAFLWVCSADAIVDPLIAAWEGAHPPLALADVPQVDAVVVLCGMAHNRPRHGLADRVEFGEPVDRVLEGARLVRAGKAPKLVISGGSADPFGRTPPEAPMLADWLVAMGLVERERIVVETQSRNTAENAARTAELARAAGWKRVILVTSAVHMRRAEGAFRRTGLELVVYPADFVADRAALGPADFVPAENALFRVRHLLHEALGLLAYAMTGRI